MSWPTGVCDKCHQYCDYRWSWGYEKPHGLEVIDGKKLCGACRVKQSGLQVKKALNPLLGDDEIANLLMGYADGLSRVMDKTGMNVDDIEEWGLDHNIERCPNCDWWTESSNLIPYDEDEVDGFCDNCRSPKT